MQNIFVRIPLVLLLLISVDTKVTAQRSMLFDEGWRFFKGDDSTANVTAFNDAGWRKVDLPHDWSIENLPGTNSPFDSAAISHVNTGFTVGGTAWYRKTFKLPAAHKGKRVVIQFDGVYMNADFWINGFHLGNHPYGYTSFSFDITDHINWNEKNTIAVQVKNEGRNSRWYSGSGIYRHVWLNIINPVHVAHWGTFITTPVVDKTAAVVNINTTIQNESHKVAVIKLITKIRDASGVIKATKVTTHHLAAGDTMNVNQVSKISSPALWSTETPVLYTAVTEIIQNNKLIDAVTTPFGIRTIRVDAVKGFQLNGKTVKLKGGCVHHDNGPLGAAAYDRAEERKIELLKASGYNAIRTSHNPPSPVFLDACDRLGMLVIEEAFDTWNERKNKFDYHLYFKDWWRKDIQSMIFRDRNHPSIIMWSSGNEIPNRGKDEVAAVAKLLTGYIKQLDSTRAVTAGVNGIDQKPDAFLNALDVTGYNYAEASYKSDHERYPNRVMFGSESYPFEAFDYWMAALDHPWVIGDFVWTAFDYIGEASIGWLGYPQNKNFYPWNLAYCGDIDICGWKRPQSYYRDALWKKDQLSIFVKPPLPTFEDINPKLESWSKWNWPDVVADWNWKGYEDSLITVVVYSSCDSVELFLNGKSFGKKPTLRHEKFMANFELPYAAGKLKAIGYRGNNQVTVATLTTAAASSKIKLTADRNVLKSNGQDLVYINVELVDANGIIDPKAAQKITFSLEGPAALAAVGNANPKSVESFQSAERSTWQGKCLVIIKSNKQPGTITLYASAPGFPKSHLTIRSLK